MNFVDIVIVGIVLLLLLLILIHWYKHRNDSPCKNCSSKKCPDNIKEYYKKNCC